MKPKKYKSWPQIRIAVPRKLISTVEAELRKVGLHKTVYVLDACHSPKNTLLSYDCLETDDGRYFYCLKATTLQMTKERAAGQIVQNLKEIADTMHAAVFGPIEWKSVVNFVQTSPSQVRGVSHDS